MFACEFCGQVGKKLTKYGQKCSIAGCKGYFSYLLTDLRLFKKEPLVEAVDVVYDHQINQPPLFQNILDALICCKCSKQCFQLLKDCFKPDGVNVQCNSCLTSLNRRVGKGSGWS